MRTIKSPQGRSDDFVSGMCDFAQEVNYLGCVACREAPRSVSLLLVPSSEEKPAILFVAPQSMRPRQVNKPVHDRLGRQCLNASKTPSCPPKSGEAGWLRSTCRDHLWAL